MQMLIQLNDPISLQVLTDALEERDIACRVDNAGMHALMPLPDVMDIRIFVDDSDMDVAQQLVRDLNLADGMGGDSD